MVQKPEKRRRGRPPAYDAEVALARALDAFWDGGYSATSLDDLSAATGMNRPSLYAAFGDKQAIYLKSLDRYRAAVRAGVERALAADRPLREALRQLYAGALAVYVSAEKGSRGCFLIGTAATEAVANPTVRAAFAAGLHELDDVLEARIRFARDQGELPPGADPAALAQLAAAIIHTLALRARAGEPRAALEATAAAAVDLICGSPRPAGSRAKAPRAAAPRK